MQCLAFNVGSGALIQVFMFAWQALLSTEPAPQPLSTLLIASAISRVLLELA